MRTKRSLISWAFIVVLGIASPLTAQQKQPQSKGLDTALPGLLEKSGYSYSKISDGVYEIPATGKNLKEFPLRITQADDLVVVIAKISDRRNVTVKEALLVKLLELNDSYDTVKLAMSSEMLYARIDAHTRLVDAEELKYLVEQMAHVVDESYPHIKPFLTGK